MFSPTENGYIWIYNVVFYTQVFSVKAGRMKQTFTIELFHLPLVHQLLYTGLDVISVLAPEKVRREARKKMPFPKFFLLICH